MAELNRQSGRIPASQQFKAIAYLRWRLFANSFRRKGGAGELVARFFTYPFLFLFIVGPALGAGFGSWAAVGGGHLSAMPAIFWGITVLQIFVSINLSQPGLSFDPESLIRFPVSFSRYLVVRLFLGLLSPAVVIGTFALLSAALGVAVARHELAWVAFAAACTLAVTNMLFLRMIFAWIDRWLSTRRAREVFTGLMILISIGIQWVNVNFNPGFSRGHKDYAQSKRRLQLALHVYHQGEAALSHFPAGAAGRAVIDAAQGAIGLAAANLLLILLFGVLFVAVFAWRMQREYRGESFSDSGSLGRPQELARSLPQTAGTIAVPSLEALSPVSPPLSSASEFSEAFRACFYKEWIYVRRNTTQLYGMLAPLAMVFLFAGKIGASSHGSFWTFPGAIAYATLGVAALSYNAFGLDAEGVQFYFLAPVRLRTVLFAKNVFNFAISVLELAVIYAVLGYLGIRPSATIAADTACWLIFAVLVNVTIGNTRSILSPKKMDPGKLSRKQASQLSALISLVVILVVTAIGGGLIYLGSSLALPWLPVGVLLVLAFAAAGLYIVGLGKVDALAEKNQETMIEELCKAS